MGPSTAVKRRTVPAGTPQTPKKSLFIAFLIKNFQKIWSFRSGNFPEIFRKRPENFSIFFKSKKTIIFASKLVQNHHIDLNLAKFSPKTPKKCQFLYKTLKFFKIFGA